MQEVMLYSVGCEPAINNYLNARSFMKAIADMTGMKREEKERRKKKEKGKEANESSNTNNIKKGGKYLSLEKANMLSDMIIYGAREEINLDKYAPEIMAEVAKVN